MSDKKEGLSKRQARREELKRKERQQRLIVLGSIGVIALVVVIAVVIPMMRNIANPAGEFATVEPVTYSNADGVRLGDPNAKVKIEIFEDFKCSSCKVYANSVEPDVIKNLVETGQAYYIFHQYPFLDDDATIKDSDRAAMASACAARQNRFWDYKNILFANQNLVAGEYSDVRLKAFAKALGLDQTQFDACLDNNEAQADVDAGIALGLEKKITGTPSILVNGVDVAPGRVPSFQQIQQAVQAALQ